MERERIHLGFGIGIYREYRSWNLELNLGERIRRSLHTRDKELAIKLALQAFAEIAEEGKEGEKSQIEEFLRGKKTCPLCGSKTKNH